MPERSTVSESLSEEPGYEQQQQPEKLKAVIVQMKGALDSRARDIAEAEMSRDKSELKGVSGIVKKIWVHNLFQAVYRQKGIAKAKQTLIEKQNLYAGERDGTKQKDHDAAMDAVVTRFASEYDDETILHGGAGETRKVLGQDYNPDTHERTRRAETGQEVTVKDEINKLILSYARGEIDKEAFAEEKVRIFGVATGKGREALGSALEYADNLLEIAEQIKAKGSYEEALENLDLDLDVFIGEAKAGVRTEAQFDMVDNIVEKLQKTSVGRLVNETTLASAVAITYSLGAFFSQRIARSKLAAVGTFGATAVLGAGLAAAREGHQLEEDRRQDARERAEGRKFDSPEKPRREKMAESSYETRSAHELGTKLENILYEVRGSTRVLRPELSHDEITNAMAALADIEARVKLSDTKSIDLISFSNVRNVESERTALDILRAQAKVDLREAVDRTGYTGPIVYEDQPYDNADFDFDRNLKELSGTTASSLSGELGERDKAFKSMKRRQMLKKAGLALATGLVIGAGAQEVGAVFNSNQEGLIGHLSGHHNTNPGAHYTMLRSLFKGHEGPVGPRQIWEQGDTRVELPVGYELHPNGSGAFSLINEGKVVSNNIHFNARHEFDPASVAELAKHHVVAHSTSAWFPGPKIPGPDIPSDQYAAEHPGEFHQIHRELWYGNDTPKPVFDKNELRADLFADKTNGEYQFSMARMEPDGSYQTVGGVKLSADARALAADGKLKMLFSLSRGSQSRVIEVPIGADFKTHVDPNSETGKLLFRMVGGKPVCLAKFAEVAQTMGDKDGVEQVRLLATAVGQGIDSVKGPDVNGPSIQAIKNILDVPTGHPRDLPPIIPLLGRTPLERENKKEGGAYYDNDQERLVNRRRDGGEYYDADAERLLRRNEENGEYYDNDEERLARNPRTRGTEYGTASTNDLIRSIESGGAINPDEYEEYRDADGRRAVRKKEASSTSKKPSSDAEARRLIGQIEASGGVNPEEYEEYKDAEGGIRVRRRIVEKGSSIKSSHEMRAIYEKHPISEVLTTSEGVPVNEAALRERSLTPEEVRNAIRSMQEYLDKEPEAYSKLRTYSGKQPATYREFLESLNRQIGVDMPNETKMSIVIPCYKEGENIYRTLLGWTENQKDVTPSDVEFIVFVNAPNAETPIDAETLSEIDRFKKEHPQYSNIKVVQNQFNFEKGKTKMGAVYKVPADLALLRNVQRLNKGASPERVASQIMRSGGADAVGRNPRFLNNLITFMDKYPETEQLRSQATYPAEVMEKFPLLHAYYIFRHGASALFTRGESNQGLGTYRARIYAEAKGFASETKVAEEIGLSRRIRAEVEKKGVDGIKKSLVKNAIDNPRRELFALVNGDKMLYDYKDYGRDREAEMRDFDWEAVVGGSKDLTPEQKRNSNLSVENATREFDTLFQNFSARFMGGSIMSSLLEGKIVDKESLPASARYLIQDDVLSIQARIQRRIARRERIDTRSNSTDVDILQLTAALARHLFDRTFRLSLGLQPGEDYVYVIDPEGKEHVQFRPRAVQQLKKMSQKKWANFEGYWEE